MAKVFVGEDGKTRTYYNPSEKASYHAEKLRSKTNPRTGNSISDFERGHSLGYLQARRDNLDIYLSKTDPSKLKQLKQKRREKRKMALSKKK